MKKTIFLSLGIVCLLTILNISAYSDNNHYQAKADKVKIYLNGVEVSSTLEINLKKGMNTIYIDSLPPELDEENIQTMLRSKGDIMSFQYEQEEITENDTKPKFILSIEDSIKKIYAQINDLNAKLIANSDEYKYINSMKADFLKEKTTFSAEFTTISKFINNRTYDLKKEDNLLINKKDENHKKIAELNKKISEYLNEHPTEKVNPNYRLIIEINSEKAEKTELYYSYYSSDAGWEPIYEIRVDDLNSQPNLITKAKIWQNTGFDWKDVDLSLSTNDPTTHSSIPKLNQWNLAIQTQNNKIEYGKASGGIINTTNNSYSIRNGRKVDNDEKIDVLSTSNQFNGSPAVTEDRDYPNNYLPKIPEGENYDAKWTIEDKNDDKFKNRKSNTHISQSNTNFSFEFISKIKYSLKSSNKESSISLSEHKLKADYIYYSIPKAEAKVYLTARVTDWTDIQAVNGTANIFFEGNYIGTSEINSTNADDTTWVSLGVDKDISIEREKINDFNESKFLSSKVEKSYGYKFKIKNNKKNPIKLKMLDQIPISTNEKIEVQQIDLSGAGLEPTNGKLKWYIDIDAGKSAERILKFKVIAPKEVYLPNN